MRSLNYIAMFDGVALPILQLQASWSVGGFADQFTLVLPGSAETERILPSTQVHLWSLDSETVTSERQVIRIDRDNLRSEGLWVQQSLQTILGQLDVPVSAEGGDSSYLKLADALPLKGYMYRGGGEVTSVTSGQSAGSGRHIVLHCQGFSGNLDRILAIQALRGRGTLSDIDRQVMGQHETVFPGSGTRAFAKGVLDTIAREDGNLLLGIKELVSTYSLKVNPMWRTRVPLTRLENQIVGLDDDTGPKRILEGPDFKKILREQLAGRQVVGLGALAQTLLDLVGYVAVAIPSPAYFPLAPSEKMITVGHKIISPERREDYIAPPGILVLVPETETVQFVTNPPPGTRLSGGSIEWSERKAGSDTQDGWWTESAQPPGPGTMTHDLPRRAQVRRTFHKGGKRSGTYKINADKSVTVRFSIPKGWTGGAASYERTLTLDVTAMVSPRHPDTGELLAPTPGSAGQATTEEVYDDFPLKHLVRYQTTTIVTLENKASQQREQLEVGIRFSSGGPRTRVIPAVTEAIEEEELVDGMLPNWVSRLNTYALLPRLWWAMFPASNIVLPHQVLSWSSSSGGMDRVTRLIAKVPPNRSGSRATYSDKFPAPTEADLDQILSEEPASFDPKKMLKFEYISGVSPDLWYVDTLSKAIRDKSWKRFMQSRVSAEFWDRRMAGETISLSVHYDPTLVTGAPLLFVAKLSEEEDTLDPELLSLRLRLRNLRRLLALLKKNSRSSSGPRASGDNLLRHLTCIWNIKKAIDHVRERSYLPERTLPSGDTVHLNWADDHLAFLAQSLKRRGTDMAAFWAAANGKPFGGSFPVSTSSNTWGIVAGLNALGLTDSTISEAGITYEQAVALFSAQTRVTASYNTLNSLMSYLQAGKRDAAARRASRAPCLAAIRADIKVVVAAISETEDSIRKLGGVAGKEPEAYIGYVSSIAQSTSGEGMSSTLQVELTHVRKVSEDLDFNGLGGDDLENVVAFGENGYLDERYSRDKIGRDVYLPIFGCTSALEIPGVQEKIEEMLTSPSGGSEGEFRELLFDLDPQMKHIDVCKKNYLDEVRKDPGNKDVLTEFDVAIAVMELYRSEIGSLPEDLRYEAFLKWKARLYMNFAESYVGRSVAYSSTDYRPEPVDGQALADELSTMYKGGEPLIQGFFATSFVGPGGDEETAKSLRPRAMKGEKERPELVEDEISLHLDRLSRVEAAAQSMEDGTTGG